MNISLSECPAATSVITKDFLKTMPRSVGVDEALKCVPGVRIDNQANGERVHMSIRGQGILVEKGIQGIKVLVDGFPLNDPTGFVSDLFDVQWDNVDRIEVLRGPSAALYGGGSNAGVVNITTQSNDKNSFGGILSAGVGSNGFWKSGVSVGGKSENLSYDISYSRNYGDGYRIHSAFNSQNVYAKLQWKANEKLNFTSIAGFTDYYNDNPEGINKEKMDQDPKTPNDDAIPKNEYQRTQRVYAGLRGDYKIDDKQSFNAMFFIRSWSYKEPGSKFIFHDKYINPTGSVQYSLNSKFGNIKNLVNAGVDLSWQFVDSYKVWNLGLANEDSVLQSNQSVTQYGIGGYLLDRIQFGDKFALTFSLRYDYNKNELTDLKNDGIDLSDSREFNRVTGRIGASYALTNDLSIYGNFGQGFLPPTSDQIMSNPSNPGGMNKNLTPQTSNGGEIGVRDIFNDNLYCDISAFYLTTENDYDRYRVVPARPLETFYRNVGDSRRFGVEASIGYRPIHDLNLQLAYTYSNFKYTSPDSIKDNWLPNSPEHMLYCDAAYTCFKGFTVGMSVEYQSEWNIFTYYNNLRQDGFTQLHARINYTFDFAGMTFDAGVSVKNLTDQKWVAFTEPDTNDDMTPANPYQPGPTREFFGTLRIHF